MNETLKVIKSRRSVRSFTDRQIKPEELQAVLEAAQYAPNVSGAQLWHFSVIQDKALINALSDEAKEVIKNREFTLLKMRLASRTFTFITTLPP